MREVGVRLRDIAAVDSIGYDELRGAAGDLFELLGLSPEDAAIAAEVALYAQLAGLGRMGWCICRCM